jgi:hypothetical protein
MTSIDVEVSVDIDDILCEMNSREKNELCQELIDEGHAPEDFNGMELDQVLKPETYSERHLIAFFNDMWGNRLHIDYKMVDELRVQLKEQNIL